MGWVFLGFGFVLVLIMYVSSEMLALRFCAMAIKFKDPGANWQLFKKKKKKVQVGVLRHSYIFFYEVMGLQDLKSLESKIDILN